MPESDDRSVPQHSLFCHRHTTQALFCPKFNGVCVLVSASAGVSVCATETERDCGEGGRRGLGIFSVALVLACVPEESLTWAFLSVILVAACARVYYHGERGIDDLGISLSVALVAACARVYHPGE